MKADSGLRLPRLLLCLLLALSVGGAGTTGIAGFFKPRTCAQPPPLRTPCGGNPENFYASQCLQLRCCHENGTCYHQAVDGPRQRRNAGILGGACAGAAGLVLCFCVARRLRGSRGAGKEAGARTDAELEDYLTKLLEESDQEEKEKLAPREEEPRAEEEG
ncbi:transmembrane protein 190 isoform X2 [Pelodiscus sinensis]|uniref:transmembrane protein 190 isoform X2 n=1 Tax=Pelodiscus sinensis TaxID=13735 RepID=UPI003F6AD85E